MSKSRGLVVVALLSFSACSAGAGTGTGGASPGGSPGSGGTATGGRASGGSATGGSATGGNATGGTGSGGSGTGGAAAGGSSVDGGVDAGAGRGSGGSSTGGRGGSASGGAAGGTGGVVATGGTTGAQPFKGVANSPCNELTTLNASWFYNWTQTATACTGVEFIPMVWGHTGAEQMAAGITTAITNIVGRGGKTVLGFNEPDTATQANMSVATAISLWPSFNNPAVRLGSPGTSANANGVTWFKDFMSMVNADTTGRLRVDFLAIHWYGWNAGSCEPTAVSLENYIKQMEAIPGNRPIWITEFGCLNASKPDRATVQAFYSGAVAMFARHPRIERYAWYPWESNNELYMTGTITALGTAFAAAPSVK